MKKMNNWNILVSSFLIVFCISFFGNLFTLENVNSSWYLENKPSFTPPNWVFGPLWTIIYVLIALSLYLSWIKASKKQKSKVAVVFGTNLLANLGWSYLFFKLQNPFLAFIDVLLIFGTIIWMILISKEIDKKAAWLLAPYLLWVFFAAILNLAFII